jgi:hypothetical protein
MKFRVNIYCDGLMVAITIDLTATMFEGEMAMMARCTISNNDGFAAMKSFTNALL